MKYLVIILVSLTCRSGFSQILPEKFQDRQWAYYNQNIQVYNQDLLGKALAEGIAIDYVIEKIETRDFVFHQYNALHVQALRTIDFNEAYNKPFYLLDFDRDKQVSLASVLLYLGENYAQFYGDRHLQRPYLPVEYKTLKDSLNLTECRQFVFDERWYLDTDSSKLHTQIINIGFVPEGLTDPIVWMDIRFFELKILDRLNMENIEGVTSMTEYLRQKPFVAKDITFGYTGYEMQRSVDGFNSELDAYALAEVLKQKAYRKLYKMDKGKNVLVEGEFANGKLNGEWLLNDKEGKKKAVFNFNQGQLEGDYTMFYPSGRIGESGAFLKGLRHGSCFKFYRDKKKLAKLNYSNGLFDGPQLFYYDNGKLYLSFVTSEGKKNGLCTIFYADGKEKMRGQFENDYIFEKWEYNIKLEQGLCSFLRDEEKYHQMSEGMLIGAMDDCTATFDYTFRHEYTQDCYDGFCVLPSIGGEIK